MGQSKHKAINEKKMTFEDFKEEILADFKLCWESRHASTIGRKEVLTGKAKFGIFGAGKELAQVVLSKFFEPGDFRSGYYRDQTMAMATGNATLETLFSQLYAHTSIAHDPNSGGRMMNGHFATRMLDDRGEWLEQVKMKNFAADLSPTAAQMLKAVGLGLASKIYRNVSDIPEQEKFSNQGNEICFATIGDASTSEGIFWESVNACSVMQVPVVFNVWDDGYGISVPKEYQTAKGSISQALSGMQQVNNDKGLDIYVVKGWDYPELVRTYQTATQKTRETHTPCLVHVIEVTQPEGHSTSGSHERYKSTERLEFEKSHDCLVKFEQWIIDNGIETQETLNAIKNEALENVKSAKNKSYQAYQETIIALKTEAESIIRQIAQTSIYSADIDLAINALNSIPSLYKKDVIKTVHQIMNMLKRENHSGYHNLKSWYDSILMEQQAHYSSHLYSQSAHRVGNVKHIPATYDSTEKAGYEIINQYFDRAFERDKRIIAFGEDVGKIGDVNQGLSGLQEKYGEDRIFDTGIREATIIGQGIGMAMRGLRPIAEIQYLDYLLYGIVPLSDDVASLLYRTAGGQKCPLIVRTRGHRLEGIWHSGSPMGMIINSLRGMHICVPRNLTQAAGMYQTLLQSDEPALVIEPLNGYRLKEKTPTNIGTYTVPLGQIEILNSGTDITIVSYGSTIRVCQEAIRMLSEIGISVELIDIQTLIPFDIEHQIVKSLERTNRLLIVDEDVYAGAAGYIMSQILDVQDGYKYLDAKPSMICARDHRPAYGTDGDYFSKPNAENIYDRVIEMVNE